MLKCVIMILRGDEKLKTYDGSKNDVTNFNTYKYLKINSAGFQNAPRGYTVIRKKGRLDYHILLITSGSCNVLHKDKRYKLTAGNLVIYAPQEEQKYSFTANSTTMWCHFTGTVSDEIITDAKLISGIYFLKPNNEIINPFSRLIQEFHTKGRENFAIPCLVELLYSISSAHYSPQEMKDYDVISPAIAYINSNYSKEIPLEHLAELTGYSKSRFSHIFSDVTGTTPKKYQNELKLKISCEMLTSTGYPINEIATICGFNDPLYYSRIFRKRYGISPKEYRG